MPSFSANGANGGFGIMVGGKRLDYSWIVLATCFIIAAIGFGIQYSFGVFFKSLQAEFGLTRAGTSVIYSAFLLFWPVFAILGGWVLDRYGPRMVFVQVGVFTGLSLMLASQASQTWHLFISYSLLLAVGIGPLYPVVMSVVSRWFFRRRGFAVGLASSAINFGTMVMALVFAQLISSYDWRMSFVTVGVISFIVIVALAFLLKRSPAEVSALAGGYRGQAVEARPADGQPEHGAGAFSLRQALGSVKFWLVFFMWFLRSSCLTTVTIHVVPHAIDLGINPVRAATVLSLFGGGGILGRIIMGRVSDSVGRMRVIVFGALLMSAAMLWLVWASDLWMLYLFGIIFGFAYGGYSASFAALIGDIFGLRNLGVIMGVLDVSWGIGAAAGPFFAGYIFDISGSYVYAFIAGAIAMLVAAGLAFSFQKTGGGGIMGWDKSA